MGNEEAEATFRTALEVIDRDPKRAGELLESAASAGHAKAMGRLGLLLQDHEPEVAQAWYEKAVALGDVTSAFALGMFLESRDPERSVLLLRQAAERGSRAAMWSLAHRLEITDPGEARRLYEQAAALESVHAMVNLGLMLRQSDPDEARHYYQMAAELGDTRAMYNLAVSTSKTDPEAALELLRRARKGGEPNATTRVIRHVKRQKRVAMLIRLQERASARLNDVTSPDGRPLRVQVVKGNIASSEFYWPWEDALPGPKQRTWSVVVTDIEMAKSQRRKWNPKPSRFYVAEFEDKDRAVLEARSVADRITAEGWPLPHQGPNTGVP